ncbi:MAG: hypothetical protein CVV42_16705 [Candidatus Riflebacteria bacterium HGW-Riflebacteria-2]|jgi:hypothetical protein|nr:MAG: hypothetical protein CVV42_16705 [Candidatus Riflebacteria bacterium HGW-Riflebacteria-2]
MTDLPDHSLLSQARKRYFTIALFAVVGAGFSGLGVFPLETARRAFAQVSQREASSNSEKKKVRAKKKTAKDQPVEVKQEEPMFLQEAANTASFMPDIYRCPECGYEQDEEGYCPDHSAIALVKVLSAGRDPLAPSELDGNEDIIVDIPLKNIEFRKEAVTPPATDTEQL